MPSIGDITGRIVITDSGGPVVTQFAAKVEGISNSILKSLSRATLGTETSVRQITAQLDKLKTQMKPTDSAKGLVADLDKLNAKVREEIAAVKAGPAAIDLLNKKRLEEANAVKIVAAQVQAGVSAESDLGKEIAKQYRLYDKLQKELDETAKAHAKAAAASEQQLAAFRKTSDIGKSLTTKVTLPLLGLSAASIKVSTDLNRSLANVSALLTDLTGSELDTAINKVKSNIQSLAPELGKSTGDLAEGFYEVVSSLGYTEDSMGQLEIAARAGAAGLASTQESINFLTAVTKTYGDTSEAAFKKVADLGFQAVNIGQTTFPQLAASIGGVAPIAQAAGVSLEEMFAVLATSTGVTGNTSEVVNQTAAAITALISPSDNLKLMYKELGVESGEAAIAQYGLVGTLQLVAQFAEKAKIPIIELLGRKEAFVITASLAGAQAKTFANNLDLMGKAAGANGAIVADAFDKQTTGINKTGFAYEQFKARAQVLGQQLGDQLAPTLLKILETVTSMAEGFGNLSGPVKMAIVVVGSLAAAIGPLLFVTGQLLLAWRQLIILGPKFIAAINSGTVAMQAAAMAMKGLVVVGVLLFINEIIKKWGEASAAVTQYNLEVAKIEGNALAFAARVSQGALYSTVSKSDFDDRIREADILGEHIKRVSGEVDKLNKLIKEGAGDQSYLAKQQLPGKEQELKNLWAAYSKVRTALAGVTVAAEKADEALGQDNPFGDIELAGEKTKDVIAELTAELIRQSQALKLLRDDVPVEEINNLVEAARELEKTNLFDPLVQKAAALKDRIDAIANAFKLADEAKKKFAEAGDDLDELIKKQFSGFGGNDPEMQKLIETLKEIKSLTGSLVTDEQKRAAITARVNQLYAEGHLTLVEQQALLIANAEQWNVELTESQVKFQQIFETISAAAEGMAYDLVDSWRSAWEQNESIVDATLDSLKNSFFDVLQDIISQWLSQWFRAMAAWLARWIATQTAAKAVSATSGGGIYGGGGGGDIWGSAATAGKAAQSSGASTSAMAGWALAAYGLYVVYKGFFEDHKTKFANIEIIAGQAKITASHGDKYLSGVSDAALQLLKSLDKFTEDLNISMEQYASIRINASANGVLVGLINSTGQTFETMEEAIAYAQVLMLKYGEFSDSVSKLVQAVIKGTKAMTPDQLIEDINFAKELETQNRPELANIIQQDIDKAVAQWRRAKELFLQPFSTDLEAWGMAIDSIITKLSGSLLAQYNQLAGIEEDPQTAWQRQKQAYNSQRLIAIAQLKLWDLEIAARIKNLQANGQWLGGLGVVTRGTLKFTGALVQAAEVLDPALQSLLDIQAAIQAAINEIPPELTDANYPGKGKGKGGGRGADRKALREDLMDEIEALQAEAAGTLHSALYDLNQNLADFRERAKEAGLSAEQLATYTELMTRKFQESLRSQAEGYAGWGNDITRRLKEVGEFFNELRELGRKQTGMPNWLVDLLEGEALKSIGTDLLNTINQFAGLLDPMAAINAQADTLRANVLAYGTAVGWTAEQIQAALDNIDQGVNLQRQQGINTALDKLFGYLKQAGLFQEDAIEFERNKALTDLALLEAQLRFYGAIDARTQEWLDAARDFVLSPNFGSDNNNSDRVQKVRVVNSTNDWDDIVDRIRDLVDSWREAVESFAKSTSDLMTDDELSPLTQEEQLEFARQNLESLAAQAQAGDLEALRQLAEARAEYLRELRESEGGGYGFDVGSDWAMRLTAEILENAQIAEQNMIATELAKTVEAWAYVMDQLADDLETTLYDTTALLIEAIYDAIGGVPSLARGGVVMNGPRLVRVAEYVPEAIVPLDRLAGMVPYNPAPQSMPFAMPTPTNTNTYDTFNRDSLARLSALEITNERTARDMSAIRRDISSIARRK